MNLFGDTKLRYDDDLSESESLNESALLCALNWIDSFLSDPNGYTDQNSTSLLFKELDKPQHVGDDQVTSSIESMGSSCHLNVPALKRKRREARQVRRKVQKLRWVVPGGRGLQQEHLFAKTAHYILHLRLKVCALQTILKLQDEA
ncbi:hypothetical protein SDJN02_18794, partial [Cucurbita argyrosperma subsp. argyrosperma]